MVSHLTITTRTAYNSTNYLYLTDEVTDTEKREITCPRARTRTPGHLTPKPPYQLLNQLDLCIHLQGVTPHFKFTHLCSCLVMVIPNF